MGQPPTEFPDLLAPAPGAQPNEAYFEAQAVVVSRRPEPVVKYVILFALTLLTTTLAGESAWLSHTVGFSGTLPDVSPTELLIHGLWYSTSVLAILGAHEFGHYFACRHYRVNASLPYFLPLYIPFIGPLLTGTLGAVIRIREPIPNKRALFDIGIAGPIAGFAVAVPLLLLGMYLSNVVEVPTDFEGSVLQLGEPLLFKISAWLTFGSVADGYSVNMHPIAFAAWFGLLATALNLFPIGQLDGGHISYAVLGRWSTYLTIGMVVCLVGLVFVSTSWLLWAVLTAGMILVIGPRHPPVWDEHVPLDRGRLWLAAFAVLMFVLCFTPAPIELVELLRGA